MVPFFRSLAIVVALSAMLLRAFLPLGWMPSTDTRAPLTICPMMGGIMPSANHGSPQHHNRFCPFTASLAQLAAVSVPRVAPLAAFSIAQIDLRPHSFQFVPRNHRAQSPRAPPLTG